MKRNPRYALSVAACAIQAPRNAWLALQSPEWRSAMAVEDQLSPADNILNSIWIFKVKQRVDRSVERLKAHLVANGACQIEG